MRLFAPLTLSRRLWLVRLATYLLAVGLLSTPLASATAAPIGDAVIFGDGYSVKTFSSVPSWNQQLVNRGLLRVVANLARQGAAAGAASGPGSLKGQVDAWLARNQPAPDFTIIYIGTDEIAAAPDLNVIKTNYQAAVNSLIADGANAGSKRIVLIQIHDVTRNPGVTTNVRTKVTTFNRFIRSLVASRPGLITVNLGALFDRVFANPAEFNLTNVETPDQAASETTALYFDANRFGKRGHQIIASEVRKVLQANKPD